MPYSPAQNKLFRAAAHDPSISKSSGIPMATARKLAAKGLKRKSTNKLADVAYGR